MVAFCLVAALLHTADAFGVRQPRRLASLQSETLLLQTEHGHRVRVGPAFFEEGAVTTSEDEAPGAAASTPHPPPLAVLEQASATAVKLNDDAMSLAGQAPQILGQQPQRHEVATVEEQGPQLLAASSEEASSPLPIKGAIATAKKIFALVTTGAHAAAQNVKPAWWDNVITPVEKAPHEEKVEPEEAQMQPGAMNFFKNARVEKDVAKKDLVNVPKAHPAMIAVSAAAAETVTPPQPLTSPEEQRRRAAQWQEVERGRAEEARQARERERQRLFEEKMDSLRGGF